MKMETKSDSSETKTDNQSNSNQTNCSYWVRPDGREFITDPNGDVVNLARLTAYAEHGKEIHQAEAHHKIPLQKIDAPAYLEPIAKEEHARFHGKDPDPEIVDGIPLLQPEA
jgi:hypothetical protein